MTLIIAGSDYVLDWYKISEHELTARMTAFLALRPSARVRREGSRYIVTSDLPLPPGWLPS